jgi:TonB family protein
MPLTQIPLQPPPPVERRPEQGDLFDSTSWESAYREMHDFPTLLIQARDELAKSRKREAFWMSVVVHILLILLIVNAEKFEKYLPHRAVMMLKTGRDNQNLSFLELPPDLQKSVTPPKTNIMSDKSRVATTKSPQIDPKQLKKLLDANRQGRPGPVAPQLPPRPAAEPPQAAQAQSPQPQPAQQPQPAPPQTTQTAKLQAPPVVRKPNFSSEPMSASRAIDQAARQAASSRSRYGGDEGDLGLGQRQPTARMGPVEIMTDTMNVDFGPYLQRVLHDVRNHWYEVIPESAMPPLLKRGKVSIEFSIAKNGEILGMRYVTPSGDVALDRAAYGGITMSNPFPPLPREFSGQNLGLRFTFFYNPDPNSADLK